MSLFVPNIIARTFYIKNENCEYHFGACFPENIDSIILPELYLNINGPSLILDTDLYYEDEAIRFQNKFEIIYHLREFLLRNFAKRKRPFFIYKENNNINTESFFYIVTNALDFSFFADCIDSASVLWKDNELGCCILKEGYKLNLQEIANKYRTWFKDKNPLDISPRFFLYEDRQSNHYTLRSLGGSVQMTQGLFQAGLEWENNKKCWSGDKDRVSLEGIQDVIRDDNILGSRTMAKIPAWFGRALSRGEISKKEITDNDVDKFWTKILL